MIDVNMLLRHGYYVKDGFVINHKDEEELHFCGSSTFGQHKTEVEIKMIWPEGIDDPFTDTQDFLDYVKAKPINEKNDIVGRTTKKGYKIINVIFHNNDWKAIYHRTDKDWLEMESVKTIELA